MRSCERLNCNKRSSWPQAEGWYILSSWDRPIENNSARVFCSLLCLKMWVDGKLNLSEQDNN